MSLYEHAGVSPDVWNWFSDYISLVSVHQMKSFRKHRRSSSACLLLTLKPLVYMKQARMLSCAGVSGLTGLVLPGAHSCDAVYHSLLVVGSSAELCEAYRTAAASWICLLGYNGYLCVAAPLISPRCAAGTRKHGCGFWRAADTPWNMPGLWVEADSTPAGVFVLRDAAAVVCWKHVTTLRRDSKHGELTFVSSCLWTVSSESYSRI